MVRVAALLALLVLSVAATRACTVPPALSDYTLISTMIEVREVDRSISGTFAADSVINQELIIGTNTFVTPVAQDSITALNALKTCLAGLAPTVQQPIMDAPLPPGVYNLDFMTTEGVYLDAVTLTGSYGQYVFYTQYELFLTGATILNGANPNNIFWVSPSMVTVLSPGVSGIVVSNKMSMNAPAVMNVYASDMVVMSYGSGIAPNSFAAAAPCSPAADSATFDADCTGGAAVCHVEHIGPDKVCRPGEAVSLNHLFYDQPVEVLSVVPHQNRILEAKVRVPIFQAYDTAGWFSFYVGDAEYYGADHISTYEARNECTSNRLPQNATSWPQAYSVHTNGVCAGFDMAAQRTALNSWIRSMHVAPWDAPYDQPFTGAPGTVDAAALIECWKVVLGYNGLKSAPEPLAPDSVDMHGLISRWDAQAADEQHNFIEYTLHINADLVLSRCRTGYNANSGLSHVATGARTAHARDLYTLPLAVVQRTSHHQHIATAVHTTMQIVAASNVTVSTTVYQPTTIAQLGIRITSVRRVQQAPVDPQVSPAGAHALEMVLTITVPQSGATRLIIREPLNLGLLMPTNCYTDDGAEHAVGVSTTGTCTADDAATGVCEYTVTIRTEKRTDLDDGSSFASCSLDRPVTGSRAGDKLYPFTVQMQRCDSELCSDVSAAPIKVVPSFFVPSFPTREVVQNEVIFGFIPVLSTTPLDTYENDLTGHTVRRFVTLTDSINVMIATLPSLWPTYDLRILDTDTAVRLYGAPESASLTDDSHWTLVASQDTLTATVRRQSKNQHDVNAGGELYEGCSGYQACDGMSWPAADIIALVVGKANEVANRVFGQLKFVFTVAVEKLVPEEQQTRRRLMSASQPQTRGRWVASTMQVTASAGNVRALAAAADLAMRRAAAVPDALVSVSNTPFHGLVSTGFVFAVASSEGGSGGFAASAIVVSESSTSTMKQFGLLIALLCIAAALCAVVIVLHWCLHRKRTETMLAHDEGVALKLSGADSSSETLRRDATGTPHKPRFTLRDYSTAKM
jgi:hypothetical protein